MLAQFSTGGRPRAPPAPGEHTDGAIAAWGFAPDEITALRDGGAIR